MKPKFFAALTICITILHGEALAYDAETHGVISYQTYQNSILSQSGAGSLVNRLGLDRLSAPLPFDIYWNSQQPIAQNPDSYIDAAVLRRPNEYERCQLQHLVDLKVPWIPVVDPMVDQNTHLVAYFPVQNWLLRGALREDDIAPSGYLIAPDKCGKPELDPNGPINRVLNHFYDPIHDTGLVPAPPLPPCSLVAPNGVCLKSVDWALGFVDSFASPPLIDTSRRNHFSYEDARQNLWLALTGQPNRLGASPNTETASQREIDAIDRYFGWATAFRSLGDTIHLLEDGAQPQHVRNDPHGPIVTSLEQQAFEGYTNARVLQDPSKANPYIRNFFGPGTPISVPPIVPGDYPNVMFSTPQRFFTTRNGGDSDQVSPNNRYGMMDYANRSFFTGGTLPTSGGNGFLEPSNSIDATDHYTSVKQPCVLGAELADSVTNLTCSHWTHAVPDSVAPGYVDILPSGFTQPPLLQESVYRVIRAGSGITTGKSDNAVGIAEFQVQANLTIPRAIGYSAGMLNYFFRGQLTLSSPPDGLYAVTDQGIPHTVDADGYPRFNDGSGQVFGFTTVRVRVKNTTPDVVESGTHMTVPQTMKMGIGAGGNSSGYLVEVARYHRNLCYQPDLSGEYVTMPDGSHSVPSGCSMAQMRTAYQEISVSAPIQLDSAGNLPGPPADGEAACANVGNINTGADASTGSCANDAALMEFDFSADAIPINATDLFLQVVYRGPLGQEIDGIAVGTKDILEPNFYTSWNNTDWYLYNGVWTLPQNVPNPPVLPADAAPGPLTANIVCFNGQLISGLATGQQLDPARFFRTAVLADIQPLQFGTVSVFDSQISYVTDGPMPSTQRQADTEQGADFAPDPIPFYGRGTTLGIDFGQYYQHYGTSTQEQYIVLLDLMPTLGDPSSPGIPLPVGLQFTSALEADCAYYFPGPYTTTSPASNPATATSHTGSGGQGGSRLPH